MRPRRRYGRLPPPPPLPPPQVVVVVQLVIEQPKQPVTVQFVKLQLVLHPVKLQLVVECVLQLDEKLQLVKLQLKLHDWEEEQPEVLQLVWWAQV